MAEVERLLDKIAAATRHKKYDCIIGVSGGIDSCFICIRQLECGLPPIAVYYDKRCNSVFAMRNMVRALLPVHFELYAFAAN